MLLTSTQRDVERTRNVIKKSHVLEVQNCCPTTMLPSNQYQLVSLFVFDSVLCKLDFRMRIAKAMNNILYLIGAL